MQPDTMQRLLDAIAEECLLQADADGWEGAGLDWAGVDCADAECAEGQALHLTRKP